MSRKKTPSPQARTKVARPDDSDHDAVAHAPTEAVSDGSPPTPTLAIDMERYTPSSLLGAGGMGEVHLCADDKIGREVALKMARDRSQAATTRFLHEARIQAQLEHPAIVPVYDIQSAGTGEAPYFTMRRVKGRTLAHVIDGVRTNDAEVMEQYSRWRLLTTFSRISMAVHYAHSRGVVHRDLKPGNVILGDFGEVYVLDWGLAKLLGQDEIAPGSAVSPSPDSGEPLTEAELLLGTPGYMAPEQVLREEPDPRADVYAMGAILFELLTGLRLHQGATTRELLDSTTRGAEARASVRAPEREVPPELEAICVKATALKPEDRYTTCRELAELVDDFLEGDRDLARRRSLARGHADAARAAADRALAGGEDGLSGRREAMAEIGKALALVPEHPAAYETLMRLISTPPSAAPPEVERAVEESWANNVRKSARISAVAFSGSLLFYPIAFWMGIRDLVSLASWVTICLVVIIGLAVAVSRMKTMPGFAYFATSVTGVTVACAVVCYCFGPMLALPGMLIGNLFGFLYIARPTWRWATVAITAMGIVVPYGLQWLGVVDPWYVFEAGVMIVPSRWLALPEVPTTVMLLVMHFVVFGAAALFMIRTRDHLDRAEWGLQMHAWHFRQLVPPAESDPA